MSDEARALLARLVKWADENAEDMYMKYPAPDGDLVQFDQLLADARALIGSEAPTSGGRT